MPTVPNISSLIGQQVDRDNPTPEHLLMTAADMNARGQLNDTETFKTPGTDLRIPFPGGGRGPRPTRSKGKRR
jgi:hypothetical protein